MASDESQTSVKQLLTSLRINYHIENLEELLGRLTIQDIQNVALQVLEEKKASDTFTCPDDYETALRVQLHFMSLGDMDGPFAVKEVLTEWNALAGKLRDFYEAKHRPKYNVAE